MKTLLLTIVLLTTVQLTAQDQIQKDSIIERGFTRMAKAGHRNW